MPTSRVHPIQLLCWWAITSEAFVAYNHMKGLMSDTIQRASEKNTLGPCRTKSLNGRDLLEIHYLTWIFFGGVSHLELILGRSQRIGCVLPNNFLKFAQLLSSFWPPLFQPSEASESIYVWPLWRSWSCCWSKRPTPMSNASAAMTRYTNANARSDATISVVRNNEFNVSPTDWKPLPIRNRGNFPLWNFTNFGHTCKLANKVIIKT